MQSRWVFKFKENSTHGTCTNDVYVQIVYNRVSLAQGISSISFLFILFQLCILPLFLFAASAVAAFLFASFFHSLTYSLTHSRSEPSLIIHVHQSVSGSILIILKWALLSTFNLNFRFHLFSSFSFLSLSLNHSLPSTHAPTHLSHFLSLF